MTPKERVYNAMKLQPTDKIPLMCQFSIGHMLQQLKVSPAEFWFDRKIFSDGLLILRDIYNFDGILVSLHGHNPNWRDEVKNIYSTDEHEIVEWNNGDKTFCPFDDLPFYVFADEKTIFDIDTFSQSDLPNELTYIPVSKNLHFEIDQHNKFDAIIDVVKNAGKEYSVHGEITSPFDYMLDIVGAQEALMYLLLNPDPLKQILSHFTKLVKNLVLEMCDTGIDAIKISSPFAGSTFISPAHYQEFVLPYEKEIAEAVRSKNIHIYTHTCGSISDRMELMFDAGISGIECLDPPPLGNVELEDAVERIGDKGFIKGNIDSVNLLLNGSEEMIREEVARILNIGRKKKGFILSTACSIAPLVKRENILLLREIVDKY